VWGLGSSAAIRPHCWAVARQGEPRGCSVARRGGGAVLGARFAVIGAGPGEAGCGPARLPAAGRGAGQPGRAAPQRVSQFFTPGGLLGGR